MILDISNKIVFEPEQKRFVCVINGEECFIEFEERDANTLDFTHTFVYPSLRGQSIAEQLVKKALQYALQAGKQVIPTCGYVRFYVQEHPNWKSHLANI